MSSDNPSTSSSESEESPRLAKAGLAETVRVSEEQFRLLVESATEYAIFLLDTSGYVLSWNIGAERIKGYRADEIIGQHFSRFYLPEDILRGHPEEELQIAQAQGRYEEEGWRLRKDGTRFLANVVITALFDKTGQHTGFSKITRDQTARRQWEEERFQRAQEQMARTFLREILFSVTEGRLRFCETTADLPSPIFPEGEIFAFTASSLAEVRRRTREAARIAGLPRDRCYDLVTAVGEAAMNAVAHATGAHARLGTTPAGTVQVWIEDAGSGIAMNHLHRVTLERGFTTGTSLGHGFWLMLKTCDRLWLLTGPEGTTLVLEQDKQEAEPQWLRLAA